MLAELGVQAAEALPTGGAALPAPKAEASKEKVEVRFVLYVDAYPSQISHAPPRKATALCKPTQEQVSSIGGQNQCSDVGCLCIGFVHLCSASPTERRSQLPPRAGLGGRSEPPRAGLNSTLPTREEVPTLPCPPLANLIDSRTNDASCRKCKRRRRTRTRT